MAISWYQWWHYDDATIEDIRDTILFLEEKKQKIYEIIKENLTDEVKENENKKLKRINVSLKSIKYLYGL